MNIEVEKDKIDPIIGRNSEIRRIIEILSRKKKNNPVLIGEAGIGKTAIVEGLTQRICKKDVPKNLLNKVIFELNISSLLAGAKFQGEFEERFKKVIETVKNDSEIIVFIDELHLVVGAGRTQGAIDASNILKPVLARGEFPVIGATTIDEYRKYIEKDTALERRFQTIRVFEPSESKTIAILRGLKKRYESFHGVTIRDNAIIAAVRFSEQLLPMRKLPDKAIDLIDEACAKKKTEIWSVPTKIDKIQRKVIELKIEKEALENEEEKDDEMKERIKKNAIELKELKEIEKKLLEQWTKEKLQLKNLTDKKTKMHQIEKNYEKMVEEGNLKKAGEIRYKIMPKLQQEIVNCKNQIMKEPPELVKNVVDEEAIAEIISQWTKIPMKKLLLNEKKALLGLEKEMKKTIKGQAEAVESVANAILRSRLQLNDKNQPVVRFLFLGPTGVGKSLIAKVLADRLFASSKKMIQINMSEYNTAHSISRLIGAPPGYIGYEQGGQLTEQIKNMPYSVILFDELEKAHPEVQKLLLQILEDGEVTDGLGKKISFRNAIIIATSNLGSEMIGVDPDYKSKIHKLIQEKMSPELYNRFTEVIVFNRLNSLVMTEIIRLELNKKIENLKNNQKILMDVDDTVLLEIKKTIGQTELGARPIKNYIEKYILTAIAKWILTEKIKENQPFLLKFDYKKKQYVATKQELN